jgi:hypothetical protein
VNGNNSREDTPSWEWHAKDNRQIRILFYLLAKEFTGVGNFQHVVNCPPVCIAKQELKTETLKAENIVQIVALQDGKPRVTLKFRRNFMPPYSGDRGGTFF